jgi:hypothetical protein
LKCIASPSLRAEPPGPRENALLEATEVKLLRMEDEMVLWFEPASEGELAYGAVEA